MSAVILAIAVVGGVGLFVGVFLGIAAIRFKVEVDEKEEAVLAALPGNNCGGCGFPGCSGLAAAIAKGEEPVNAWIMNIMELRTAGCCPLSRTVVQRAVITAVWASEPAYRYARLMPFMS